MTDDKLRAALDNLRRLSDAATPGPWIRRWASLDVHHMTGDDALQAQADIDFAVAATAYVRDALAASATDEGPRGFSEQLATLGGPIDRDVERGIIEGARPAVPALDVEWLATALDADWSPAWRETPVIGPNGVEFTEARWDKRALAEIVAREYAALQEQPE